MKASEYGKLVRLTKSLIEGEKSWGEDEIAVRGKAGLIRKIDADPAAPDLESFKKEICGCKKCGLGNTRLKFVFGVGSPEAELMFVGEGPGYAEDHQGEPFVGKAGQLLTKIIESIGLKREQVYIANIVKCHPMIDPSDPEKRSNDRPPNQEEIQTCLPYLLEQIRIIHPRIICALGTWAARTLLHTELGITKLRNKFYDYNGIKIMPTYHPAALLRNELLKKDVWEDMKLIREELKKEYQSGINTRI
jgi:uracil-DNA glycosylase